MDDQVRVLRIGDVVVYLDEHRKRHNALVTIWHGCTDGETVEDFKRKYDAKGPPAINLLYVSSDPTKTDPYGRQLEQRQSSVIHGSLQSPPNLGRCYLWPDEVD